MDIVEATKAAMEQGKGITKADLRQMEIYLLPTNLYLGFMVVHIGYKYLDDNKPLPRWQPQASDILADDWELYG